MGYAFMPRLEDEPERWEGDEFAYCREECNHRDCQQARKDRASICHLCGKSFGAGDKYYHSDEEGFTHAVCQWRELEKKRKA